MVKRLALMVAVVLSMILVIIIILPLVLIWWPICGLMWVVKGDPFEAKDYMLAPWHWVVDLPYKYFTT